MLTPSLCRRDFVAGLLLAAPAAALANAGVARAQTAAPVAPPASAAPATSPSPAGFDVAPWQGPADGWRLLDTSGKTWTAADTRGRAVLLNFWASWCEPCRAEMPSLQQLAGDVGPEKLLVLAINFKEPAARALQFAQNNAIKLPVLLDADGAAARALKVNIFPTTLAIDSRGKPRWRIRGEVDWASLSARQLVSTLL